jgi:mannose-6-phosphate isomerase-like protein (cupin superfamily)
MLKNAFVLSGLVAAVFVLSAAELSAQPAAPAAGRGGNTGSRVADPDDVLAASAALAQLLDRGAQPAIYKSGAELLATLKAQSATADASDRIVTQDAFHVSYVTRRGPGPAIAHATGLDKGSEVHIIVDGAGTIVTGGKIVRPAGAGGGRGGGVSTVVGGVSQHVVKGDVVVIPAGSPHWYKEIEGSITYFEIRFDLHRSDKSFVELQK